MCQGKVFRKYGKEKTIDPYSHIVAAQRSFDKVVKKVSDAHELREEDYPKLKEHFFGGALFPDLGNYPGGDKVLSDLAHNLRTWDIVKALFSLSRTKEELVFSYGWALHVVTDIVGHPQFTNVTQAEIMGLTGQYPNGIEAYDWPLEHKRTEFGASANLLGREEYLYLWDINLSFPFPTGQAGMRSIVEEAFRRVYAVEPDSGKLRRGMVGLAKEMKRIPVVMKLLGSIRGKWYDFADKVLGFFLGRVIAPVYILFLNKEEDQGKIAVLRPFQLEAGHVQRLNSVIDKAVEEYGRGLDRDFASMDNINLDSGVLPRRGRSRHADALMDWLESSSAVSRFDLLFGRGLSPEHKGWIDFKARFSDERV